MLEFGSGYSTLFWASRCKKVYAVEDDAKWHAIIAPDAPANVEYLLLEDRDAYINAARTVGEPQFDIIIVDGSHRYQCAENSRPLLNPSGFMILDNSDWREETSRFLRDSDLIEVDMSGFGPINPYTWTTSFYFSRQVQLKVSAQQNPSILRRSFRCRVVAYVNQHRSDSRRHHQVRPLRPCPLHLTVQAGSRCSLQI